MSDESLGSTSVSTVDQSVTEPEAGKEKLDLAVAVSDAGPCKKHVKVTVPRKEVDKFFDKEFYDLVRSAAVPGFRPGKTPRKLVERRFKKDVGQQVKSALLMKSLEQIDEETDFQPLTEPNIDFASIELPEEGDFVYEFEVEVRPEFDLPEYKGLNLKRPTKEFSAEDIEKGKKDFLRRFAKNEPKEGGAERGDKITADVRFLHDKEVLHEIADLEIEIDDELTFRDGKIEGFADKISGAKVGDSRQLKAKLSDSAARENLRGKEIDTVFAIKEVHKVIVPAVNEEFLSLIGMGDEGEFTDLIVVGLKSRLAYAQDESIREQIIENLLKDANWDLPQDLLRRQAERALHRKILQLQSGGFADDEIRGRINTLRQNILATTARSLKQQFVLQRIAEEENIEINQEDLEDEVRRISEQTNEPIRRVRARIDKDNMWETLALLALERKTLDRIKSLSTIADSVYEEEQHHSTGLDEEAAPPEPSPLPTGDDSSE